MATTTEILNWIESNKFEVTAKMFKQGTKKQKQYAADLMNKYQYYSMSNDYQMMPVLTVDADKKKAVMESRIAKGASDVIDSILSKSGCPDLRQMPEQLVELSIQQYADRAKR